MQASETVNVDYLVDQKGMGKSRELENRMDRAVCPNTWRD